jgi:hypothetical protein
LCVLTGTLGTLLIPLNHLTDFIYSTSGTPHRVTDRRGNVKSRIIFING